ncbi:MAG: DUF4159 domain-containing protein [Gemmatimonadetes bacterium]|nr:DUF4159 domain-containing protein [Gemmatimonadota bacterium]
MKHAMRGVCGAAGAMLLLAAVATDAGAQRGRRFPGGDFGMGALGDPNSFYTPPDFRGNPPYDGRFTFARIKYRGFGHWSGREGPGWSHDYPDADVHLTKIIREITTMRPFTNLGDIIGGAIVALDDPALAKYPVAYLSEPGAWYPNPDEAAGLRKFLLKGGFVIVDDFNGFGDWPTFEAAIQKVVPELQPIPLKGTEAIFDSFFKVDIRGIGQSNGDLGGFGGRGGRGGFRGGGGGPPYGFYGIFEKNDPTKRLMMLVCYGRDIGEAWQWSGSGFVPVDESNEAFKLGVNFIIYALTH